jgi:hypothetical protein
MPQSIRLNIIPFTPHKTKLSFAFYLVKEKGMAPIHWSKLFETFPEGREAADQFFYTDFLQAREGAIEKEIDLLHCISFAKHYFSYLILQYFQQIDGAIVFPSFTQDVSVWFEVKTAADTLYKVYNKYSIDVQYSGVVYKQFNLALAYNGISKVLRTPVSQIQDLDTRLYTKVLCNGSVWHYEHSLPTELKEQPENVYPVLNYNLKKQYDIYEELKKVNRYPIYYGLLESFYNHYLNTPTFNKIVKLDPKGFYTVPDEKVYAVGRGNNILEFKNGTDINPGLGIIRHKPLKANTDGHLKLFFIYNKADADFVKGNMYKFMMEGWHGTINGKPKDAAPLISYINQPFSFDAAKQTSFISNDTIFEEVKEQLDKFSLEPNCTYVAIYISPIKKDDKAHPQHNAYYKIKEHLLDKGITSQVIYKEHLDKPEFYYFLPNIYVALLAKMGGIPWRLARSRQNELIIGVGAFKHLNAEHRFVGSAFCFGNDGRFEGFNCYRSNETKMLAGSIKDSVEKFIEQHQSVSRVIIHFYKEISDPKELQPILNMLDNIGHAKVPVIVVTVNKTESRELLAFDMNSSGKMPVSGTFLSVGFNKFLLFNNVRYKEDAYLSAKDYHFPVKLSFKSSKPAALTMEVIGQLIDQVYQFSRMYWKSISQQNLPVTTIYPEMVAEVFPHFERDDLPEFAKKNLWFL